MKFYFFILFFLFSLQSIQAAVSNEEKMMLKCSIQHIPSAKEWIEDQTYNTYDKFKHCSVSCYLDLRCGRAEVGLVGIMKEIRDAFGPGNAEIADLKADFYGLRLVRKKLAINDEECARECNERYPMP